MSVKAFGKNVFLKELVKERTDSGIYLVNPGKVATTLATVLSVGDKVDEVVVGDVVCVDWGKCHIMVNTKDQAYTTVENIIGVIDEQ